MHKAILLQIAFLFWGAGLSAQIVPIQIVGTVTSDMSGVGGVEVFITAFFADSSIYLNTVVTNDDGTFNDTFNSPDGQTAGTVMVSIIDCNGDILEQYATWAANNVQTLSFDFNYCAVTGSGDSCGVYIIQESVPGTAGDWLFAIPVQGNAVAYLWSTGDSSAAIQPAQAGTYCVTIAMANGCTATDCYAYVQDSTNCFVMINPSPNWPPALYAEAYGVPPFTYAWSTGETGPEIAPADPGTYCVTINDATGCEASSCFVIDQGICDVIITSDPAGTLTAQGTSTNPMNIFYMWSTGETTPSINPAGEGLYCVTINDNTGCVDSACTYYVPVANCGVQLSYAQDSSDQVIVAASPYGAAPFTFNWSTGATTSYITLDSLEPGICVTITDNTGCEASACTDSLFYSCAAWIVVEYTNTGTTLTAVNNGTPLGNAMSYQWSNGATTPSISVTQSGDYCVVIATSTGCTSTACVTVDFFTGGDTCNIVLTYSTTTDSSGQVIIELAAAGGTPPYTYSWSTGDVTPYVVLPDPGMTVCVTVTDANGCTEAACIYPDPNQCYVTINADLVDTSAWVLTANGPNSANYQYSWSNGETSPAITVSALGTYCVTVTGGISGTMDSCYAVACITLDSFNDDTTGSGGNIAGYVLGLPNAFIGGSVELYQVSAPNNGNNAWPLIDSTTITQNYYVFNDVPPGLYAVKATPENNPGAAVQYLPTYHYSTVEWQSADLVAIPNMLNVTTDILLMSADSTNGTGIISGAITDDDGLLPVPVDQMRSGGIPGILILLHRADGTPVAFTYSDVAGAFTFEELPFGQYVVTFDVPGITSPELWVTIGASQPFAEGLVLTTTKLTSATQDLLEEVIDIYPIPATDYLMVRRHDGAAASLDISLITIEGKILARYPDMLGQSSTETIPVGHLQPGLYLIRLVSGQGQMTKQWVKQ